MARLILLGTATAVPTPDRGPTSLAVEGADGFVVVDCGENPLRHLARAGLPVERLRGLFLTHFHPDHVAGVAPFLQSLWLLHREDPLPIFGVREVVESVWDLLSLFGWERWERMYPVVPVAVEPEVGVE
ncbi:MAG TPA: MBL fold metallo-hydrolase, partial [Anaerolineales bacterium]|nr:MBL fold metallo-hydrolase [Anaerolineales bacterium]